MQPASGRIGNNPSSQECNYSPGRGAVTKARVEKAPQKVTLMQTSKTFIFKSIECKKVTVFLKI
jgi:hypothetical protein